MKFAEALSYTPDCAPVPPDAEGFRTIFLDSSPVAKIRHATNEHPKNVLKLLNEDGTVFRTTEFYDEDDCNKKIERFCDKHRDDL